MLRASPKSIQSKQGIYTRTKYRILYHIVPIFLVTVTHAHRQQLISIKRIIKDWAAAVHWVLTYLDANILFRRLTRVTILKSRGVLEKKSYDSLVDFTKFRGYIEWLYWGYTMHGDFSKDESPLAGHKLP